MPNGLLVIVREQLGWQRVIDAVRALVLGLGQRCHQGPNIELNGSFATVEQIGDSIHSRVQGVLPPVRQGHGGTQQRCSQCRLRDCYTASGLAHSAAAYGVVLVVAGVVVSHNGIGIVVTAVKEHADQRFVVSGVKRCGLSHGCQVQRKRQRRAGKGQLATATQERATRVFFGIKHVHDASYF